MSGIGKMSNSNHSASPRIKTSNLIVVSIVLTILLELAVIVVLTALFTSDFGTNQDHIQSGYVSHRVGVMVITYIFAIMQAGFEYHRKMVRPETVVFNVLKTTVYMFLMSAMFFVIVATYLARYIWMLELFPILFVMMVLIRLVMRAFLRRERSRGCDRIFACLVGKYGDMEELLTSTMDLTAGFDVVGYFEEEKDNRYPENIRYLGKREDIIPWLESEGDYIKHIYYAQELGTSDHIKQVYKFCDNHLIHFFCIPMVKSVFDRSFSLTQFGNTPIVTVRPEPLSTLRNRAVKRIFDICFSLLFLTTLFPIIFVVFGTWIKLSSKGPIFFKQKRSGLDNKEFWCYKFRSMKKNDQADTVQATKGDARVTYVGHLMRKTSIDETPQFLNVLLGDMSIVGPRPHMVKHTEQYSGLIDKYMVRHFVKPGITGWAQVTGFRGETKELEQMEGRVKKDIWYIENWSLILDLVIIFKTVYNALGGEEQAY